MRRIDYLAAGCVALMCCGGGCSGPGAGGGHKSGWMNARLPDASLDAAFDAGVYAMGQWFSLDEVSREDGEIRSAPQEYRQEGGTGRLRDNTIGYRNRMRRVAALTFSESERGCVAHCRVLVDRLDTSDHRVFRRNDQFADVPNETPIDNDAGIRPDQAQVWTPMPRDRERERQILALLRERVGG